MTVQRDVSVYSYILDVFAVRLMLALLIDSLNKKFETCDVEIILYNCVLKVLISNHLKSFIDRVVIKFICLAEGDNRLV
jgi:hypothetical protein